VTFAGEPVVLPVTETLDAALEEIPQAPAVFVIWPREGEPYLGKTGLLRRRLKRLLRHPAQPSRLLNLRTLAARVEYWPAASRLQMSLLFWDVARQYVPNNYLDLLKLRYPAYVKLVLGNEFARTQITTRLGGASGQYYGPFRSRAAAEEFEHQFLDLFQLRRCQEDLTPAPDHPGCIYGEMSMCLRPCQQIVGREEYESEARRVSEFLSTGGRHLLRVAEDARDRFSAELDYEAAAREHRRIEKIQNVLKLRDELVADIDHLHGVAVTPSSEEHSLLLWFVVAGFWQPPVPFSIALADQSVSMDRRLKDVVASMTPAKVSSRDRQEHLSMLARWFYSSWRDGEWISIPVLAGAPYRKIIAAISRAARV
jgi:excinuclease UvrABC nuclease subunit